MSQSVRSGILQYTQKTEREVRDNFLGEKDFDRLLERFAFYTPAALWVSHEKLRMGFNDPITSSLQEISGVHPIVITEMTNKLFTYKGPLILGDWMKSAERCVCAVETEVWQMGKEGLKNTTIFDGNVDLLGWGVMSTVKVRCPMNRFVGLSFPVNVVNFYSNKDTLSFEEFDTDLGNDLFLKHLPPVKEIKELAETLIPQFKANAEKAAGSVDPGVPAQAPDPGDTVSINAVDRKLRKDIEEMISFYKEFYGTGN